MTLPLPGQLASAWLATVLLCVALMPSAWLAWQWRAMPQTGIFHDDAIYLVAAKSLAEGNGYRIASLPGEPFQTKYPPVYPALLSLIWRADSQFPANLPKVMLLTWSFLAVAVFLVWRLMRQAGFTRAESVWLAAFLAVAPVAVEFSVIAMSELPFLVFIIGSLLLLEREQAWWAGVVGGAAFLTRGAALPLLITAPLVYLWRGQPRKAGLFFCSMLPAVVGWQVWAATHRAPADPLTLFYTDYFAFHRQDVPVSEWPSLFVSNLSPAMKAIGDLLVFDPDTGFLALTLSRLLTVASISGSVRLMRDGRLIHYGWFAAAYFLQFLFWNYPPTSRFFLPLLPLAAAGLWREGQSLRALIASSYAKRGADRVVAVAAYTFLALVVLHSVRGSATGIIHTLPAVFRHSANQLAGKRDAYRWIAANTEQNATILSYEDPLDYLYTQRHGYSLRLSPGMLKRADHDEIATAFRNLPEIITSHKINHVLMSQSDYHLDALDLTLKPYRKSLQEMTGFEQVFAGAGTVIYSTRKK